MIYNLRTDRNVTPEPSLPTIGPAGSSYTDPVFNTKITRVTDPAFSASIGAPKRAFSTGSGGEQNTWNKDSTAFIVQDLGGGVWIPFSLTGKIATPNTYFLPLNGPAFSYSEARMLFGRSRDDFSLCKYNLDTQGITKICDFPHSTVGEVSPSGNDRVVTFGNGAQDTANELYLWDGSKLRVLDTHTGKLDGAAVSSTGVSFPFGIHNARIDRSGRFVVVTSSTSFDGTNWKADAGSPLVIWDVDQSRLYLVGRNPNGHKCSGNGHLINQDVADTPWDGMQWLIRSLGSPDTVRSLINPVLQPTGLNRDSHLSWNNHTGQNEPVLISIYRNQNDASERDSPFRTWDGELILVSTDGSGTVYRVCHHRSVYEHFWDGPHAVISPDGSKAVFTSNLNKSLGIGEDGESRRDVLMVDLSQSAAPPPPLPLPLPQPLPSTTITYVYESRPWSTSTTATAKAANLKLLNDMGAQGYECPFVIGSTAFFKKTK